MKCRNAEKLHEALTAEGSEFMIFKWGALYRCAAFKVVDGVFTKIKIKRSKKVHR